MNSTEAYFRNVIPTLAAKGIKITGSTRYADRYSSASGWLELYEIERQDGSREYLPARKIRAMAN